MTNCADCGSNHSSSFRSGEVCSSETILPRTISSGIPNGHKLLQEPCFLSRKQSTKSFYQAERGYWIKCATYGVVKFTTSWKWQFKQSTSLPSGPLATVASWSKECAHPGSHQTFGPALCSKFRVLTSFSLIGLCLEPCISSKKTNGSSTTALQAVNHNRKDPVLGIASRQSQTICPGQFITLCAL